MRTNTTFVGVVVVFLAIFVATEAFAQVSGKVTDEWENALPSVAVTIEREDGGREPIVETTDDDGEFFLRLDSGRYTFTFVIDGYQPIRTGANIRQLSRNSPIEVELEYLGSTGGRLRGDQDFEAEGGSPKITFKEDGTFEFEDAEGEEGEGHYGIVEQAAHLIVRDYDGDDDKYSVVEPVVVPFSTDQFNDLTWEGLTLTRQQ